MNQAEEMTEEFDDDAMTLDPPGTIAVIGAGPLGIEAALYGRFMGYDVTIFEAVSVASSYRDLGDQPLPMLPDRSLSPLAISAIRAQRPDSIFTLPMTYEQWIGNSLEPLMETDLLRGRLRCPARVVRIETVQVAADEPDEDTSDIPPDFRLTWVDAYGRSETFDTEAVLLATGKSNGIGFDFPLPTDYLFSIGGELSDQPLSEESFLSGLKEIVGKYAELAGRADLDLYRPLRG